MRLDCRKALPNLTALAKYMDISTLIPKLVPRVTLLPRSYVLYISSMTLPATSYRLVRFCFGNQKGQRCQERLAKRELLYFPRAFSGIIGY